MSAILIVISQHLVFVCMGVLCVHPFAGSCGCLLHPRPSSLSLVCRFIDPCVRCSFGILFTLTRLDRVLFLFLLVIFFSQPLPIFSFVPLGWYEECSLPFFFRKPSSVFATIAVRSTFPFLYYFLKPVDSQSSYYSIATHGGQNNPFSIFFFLLNGDLE